MATYTEHVYPNRFYKQYNLFKIPDKTINFLSDNDKLVIIFHRNSLTNQKFSITGKDLKQHCRYIISEDCHGISKHKLTKIDIIVNGNKTLGDFIE